MRVRFALLAVMLAACGKGEPSAADKERAAAAERCTHGDGPSCEVAAMGLDYVKPDQLQRALGFWRRGCELRYGPSCGQLGIAAEHGMESGGRHPDPVEARAYYNLACKLGDQRSCNDERRLAGLPPEPAPKQAFPWREALTPICSKRHGELGPLFDGLVLGQPMPAAMQGAITAYEKQFHARVHYTPGDGRTAPPGLDVRFDEKDGLSAVLIAGWGKPDLPFGEWWSEEAHVAAYYTNDGHSAGIAWTPYRSVAELILPDDKTRLGFEPIPVVGAKLADVQRALGDRLAQTYDHEYGWGVLDAAPNFEVRVTEQHGIVTELRTQNWSTHTAQIDDALFAALETKWGKPAIDKTGTHTWRLPGRVVRASAPLPGNFEILIAKR